MDNNIWPMSEVDELNRKWKSQDDIKRLLEENKKINSFSMTIHNNLKVVYETKALEVMYYNAIGMHEKADEIYRNRKFPLPEKIEPGQKEIEFNIE